jgi:tRNA A-37 threonylcarbamoyl transferase component Bud32
MLTAASMTAARAKARGAFWVLLWDACRRGKPRWMDILVHLIIWLVPWKLRTRMAVMLDGIGWSRLALKRDKDRNLVQPGKGLVGIPSEHRPGLGSAWKAAQGFSENTLELCWAIISGAPGTSLKELRTERGKRTFQVTVSSGATTENIILKEFGSRGPIDAVFLRHLRPGPGCRYAAAASAIRDAGVLTAHIRFAALGKAPDGPRYLIGAEEIKGAHTLGEVLTWLSAPERAGLFKTVGRAVAQLHHAGIFHFDLNEDNLLFRVGRDDLEGPYLVDLDYTVRTSVRRRQLCRLLARLDLHQFFTIRNAEIKREDRCMFKSGYRSTERQAQPISWRILLGGERASRQVRRAGGGETDVTGGEEVAGVATYSNMDMPQRKYYPRWKRIVGTSLIHLFRGVLLVCRLVH